MLYVNMNHKNKLAAGQSIRLCTVVSIQGYLSSVGLKRPIPLL